MAYQTIDPNTNTLEKTYSNTTPTQISEMLATGHAFYKQERNVNPATRAATLHAVAAYFRNNADEMAAIITREMGKRTEEALFEVELCAEIADMYADRAPALLQPQPINSTAGAVVINHLASGIVFGVEPWNFPYYQLMRVFAPNFMVGNAVIIKPSSNVPASGLEFEKAVLGGGADKGAFQIALIGHADSETFIKDPRVAGVCLTGSERSGSQVAALAGKYLKKSLLELGGMDAFLVLDGADLDTVIPEAIKTRLMNCGQVCTSSKRFIVLDKYYDDFVAGLKKGFENLKIGDPSDPTVNVGPMTSQKAKDKLQKQVDEAIAHGAKVVYGNTPVDLPGAFFQPTILTDIDQDNPAYRTELFGPVACVYKVHSEDEAVELANDVPYGLGGAVFAGDTNHAAEVAARIETGMVGANQSQNYNAELPFGGVKNSGYGRELGDLGLFTFVNEQTVTRALRR
ncbi:NAD-dependent aldehyde dehydrogenase [Lacticaseibacillus paracasei subsp. paracasei Lpp70]|uniref:NAD-dependent succinate-semialdehyde dehydrogenase n=1 Tax=Lacticaseibacillus paracasei TaxID=1597 RepID=UPI000343C6C6|nr:NAD-dependent aldehyde dehydrogenase [Lacticaseibacillus paracasei subsp. paracasei Lpp70]